MPETDAVKKLATKHIESCYQCPWFKLEHDARATLPSCQHPRFDNGEDCGYRSVIVDIPAESAGPQVSKYCPIAGIKA